MHMMLARGLAISLILGMCGVVPTTQLGYYMGGTIFWEVRNPDNPREITIDFEFNYDSREDSSTHYQCTQDRIDQHKKLRTGGRYLVDGRGSFANYYCTHLDSNRHTASGSWRMTYTLPSDRQVAEITYKECCWIPGLLNNAAVVGTGRGWNLASTINTDHGDGTINSPPKSKTFAMYSIQSGCRCRIHIPSDDANNDKVRCRWTREERGECNPNALDICGTPYFDGGKTKQVAELDKRRCTLTFGKAEAITPGTYAMMIMIEDYSPLQPKKAMSKTPVHFLLDVFSHEGECRQPHLDVPDDVCFVHVLGEEFSMRMVATATAPGRRITSIDVQGFPTDVPQRVPGTEADYFIIFRFMPTERKTYTICAIAREDNRFGCTQSCFTVDVSDEEPAALRADPANSIPAEGDEKAEPELYKWAIKFNRKIRKGVFGPAYVTLRDANGQEIWQVDATGPDALVVNGENLTFPNSDSVFLEFGNTYTISLDEGVVQSDDGSCSVKSKPSEWSFIAGRGSESEENQLSCSISSMKVYVAKIPVAAELDGNGPEIMHLRDPECTGANFNDTHYFIWTSYGECGTTFQRNSTHITYSNVVYIPEKPYRPVGTEVTRFPQSEINFSCSLPAGTVKTLEYLPQSGYNLLDDLNARPPFVEDLTRASFKLYDAQYHQAYADSAHPLDQPLNSRLYFQAEAKCSSRGGCDAFFQSCWATTSDNPYDWPRHKLIENGCEVDETVRLHDSGVANKVRFSVDTFAFLGWRIRDAVFVNCHVFICSSSDIDSICKAGCQPKTTFERANRRVIETVVSSPGLIRRK